MKITEVRASPETRQMLEALGSPSPRPWNESDA